MNRSDHLPARPRFFYGWVIVAIAFVTMAVAISARTGFSLLFPALIDEFGWSRGVTAGAFSIGFVASTAFVPLVGLLMDRFGPRVVIPLGGVLVGAGYLVAPFISTPIGLYASVGLLITCGSMATSYIVHSMFLPNWFVRRRGLAVGLAFSGVGVGGIVLFPMMQWLIAGEGWRTACIAMGVVVIAIVVPLNALLQRARPQDMGLEPDGDMAAGAGSDRTLSPDPVVDREWTSRTWTLATAMRTARFWWVFGGYFCGLFVWYAIQVHQTRFLLEAGFEPGIAAAALGLVGLFGIAGQIGIGALSDRVGREIAWTCSLLGYAASSALLLVLADAPSVPAMYLMVITQGLLGYGLSALFGAIPAEIFAGPRFASIFGILSLGGNLGAGAGPWVLGILYDVTGTYAPGFWICLAFSFVSIGCIWMAAPRKVRLVAGRARSKAAM
jgi:MFS family permease